MNIILGISHPKHVYIFKNLYSKLIETNHNVLVLVSNKEMTCDLLDKFNMKYKQIGNNRKRMFFKIIQLIQFIIVTLFYTIKTKPDLFLGFGYIHFALISSIFNKPFVFLEDTEVANKIHKMLLPFTNSFLTTKNFKNTISNKQIRLNANLELAYLHPRYKEKTIKKAKSDKYIFLRFVSWDAFHDAGHSGLSQNMKELLVQKLSEFAKVYISSEGSLPPHLEKYILKIDPSEIHEFIANAHLVIGESPTMTTEAAMLGTPAICISSWACNLGNFEELIQDELIYCYKPNEEEKALDKSLELIQNENIKLDWNYKAEKFINDRIDLTEFLFWYVENYPKSFQTMKENPDYQNIFK